MARALAILLCLASAASAVADGADALGAGDPRLVVPTLNATTIVAPLVTVAPANDTLFGYHTPTIDVRPSEWGVLAAALCMSLCPHVVLLTRGWSRVKSSASATRRTPSASTKVRRRRRCSRSGLGSKTPRSWAARTRAPTTGADGAGVQGVLLTASCAGRGWRSAVTLVIFSGCRFLTATPRPRSTQPAAGREGGLAGGEALLHALAAVRAARIVACPAASPHPRASPRQVRHAGPLVHLAGDAVRVHIRTCDFFL